MSLKEAQAHRTGQNDPPHRVRILVVDDDANITAFLRRALAYEGYRVMTADDGPSALATARDEPPELVVLDVMLPGLDGVEVVRRLRAGEEEPGKLPVLMLTARDEVTDRVAGLDAGADDYLPKPFALEELVARIRALLRRREPETPRVLRFADLTLDTTTREVHRAGRAIHLTAKEYDLLLSFMRHPRQVLTRDQLLEQVWGFASDIDTHVLEVYVGYLRQKMETPAPNTAGSTSLPRLIHTLRGVGYLLREPAAVPVEK